MAKSKSLIALIKEIVRVEVQKEVNKIFIKEGVKAITQNKGIVPEVLAKPISKRAKPKAVSYTKNSTLNKILNETAQSQEFDEYPTMGGAAFDSTKIAQALGYGNVIGGNDKVKREMAAVQTAQAVGADTSNKAVQDVMSDLTKDYRGVMKALDKRDGK
jgi:hypothetical protein